MSLTSKNTDRDDAAACSPGPCGLEDSRQNGNRPTHKGSGYSDADTHGLQPADELRRRWRRGERTRAEELIPQFPSAQQRSEVVLDLLYEEYLQRQADGDDDVEQDLLRRFPQWREPLRLMIDCHRLLQPSEPPPDYPEIGDWLDEFRLLAELGQGARGRVCLAAQTDLADRLVVLKLTPLDGVEHLSLARLQHTNIVPVYSVVDDPRRRLRILVMPYFGRATLATLLTSLAAVPLATRRGEHLVTALDQVHDPLLPAPVATPTRQMLSHVSYTQAVCWLAASLADALQYAHDRGLVHLDVNPSNVLLAAEGQPMLLDFHLACEPVRPGGPLPDRFGGTPEYMPPEQRQAMLALQDGRPIETDVDARADIFSLGAIVCELLGGQLPPESNSPPLVRSNSQVSVGLSDIVAKCLSPQPQDRYLSAAALADDLRRHLADQPLAHAPNRSLSERWYKWRRRQPNTLRIAGLLAVVVLAVLFGLTTTVSQSRQSARDAESLLVIGRDQLRRQQTREAVSTLERGARLMDSVAFRRDLAEQLHHQLAIARRSHLAAELRRLADQARVLSCGDVLPAEQRRSLANLCRQFWEQRHDIATRLNANSDADVAADLLDVAIFWASLQRQLETDPAVARESARRTLDEAEHLFGSSPVLDYERVLCQDERQPTISRRHTRQSVGSQALANVAPEVPLCRPSEWEHYALGRALLNANRLSEAVVELNAARAIAPANLWANFYLGLCTHRLGRHEEAAVAFSVCIGAAPSLAGCYFNRALSLTATGRTLDALRDFDQAIKIEASFTAAWLNRATLHLQLNNLDAAEADLRQALVLGADVATVQHNLDLVHRARR